MKDFIELANEKRFEKKKDSFLSTYLLSQDLGNKMAEAIIPFQELAIKNIEARAELAKAYDMQDYEAALKAEEDLLACVAEVQVFLNELEECRKESS